MQEDVIKMNFVSHFETPWIHSGTLYNKNEIVDWIRDSIIAFIEHVGCYPFPSSYREYLTRYNLENNAIVIYYTINNDLMTYDIIVDLFWPDSAYLLKFYGDSSEFGWSEMVDIEFKDIEKDLIDLNSELIINFSDPVEYTEKSRLPTKYLLKNTTIDKKLKLKPLSNEVLNNAFDEIIESINKNESIEINSGLLNDDSPLFDVHRDVVFVKNQEEIHQEHISETTEINEKSLDDIQSNSQLDTSNTSNNNSGGSYCSVM